MTTLLLIVFSPLIIVVGWIAIQIIFMSFMAVGRLITSICRVLWLPLTIIIIIWLVINAIPPESLGY